MSVERFSHLAIRVSDLERSRRFYRDALGFEERTELSIEGGPTALLLGRPDMRLDAVFLERDGVQVELQSIDAEVAPDARGQAGFIRIGLAHIAFRVRDLTGVEEAVVAAGGSVLEASRFRSGELGSHVLFVADPDGIVIELIEAPGDPQQPPGRAIGTSG